LAVRFWPPDVGTDDGDALVLAIIGFVILGLVFLLGLLTVVSAIYDFIRSRSLKYILRSPGRGR
jgi:branched-subunit amino acid permease